MEFARLAGLLGLFFAGFIGVYAGLWVAAWIQGGADKPPAASLRAFWRARPRFTRTGH